MSEGLNVHLENNIACGQWDIWITRQCGEHIEMLADLRTGAWVEPDPTGISPAPTLCLRQEWANQLFTEMCNKGFRPVDSERERRATERHLYDAMAERDRLWAIVETTLRLLRRNDNAER